MNRQSFLDSEQRRPIIFLGPSTQRGQPGVLSDPLELCLEFTPPSPIIMEALIDDAGSSTSAERTQIIDSESVMDPLELRLEISIPGSPPRGPSNVEDSDDDVVMISRTAFRQAVSSRRTGRTRVTDVDSVCKERRQVDVDPQPTDVNTMGTSSSMVPPIAPPPPPPPPPPTQPTYECPICFGPITEETTTSCGHIFCEGCIKCALSIRAECPVCRRKITHQGIHRIYFYDPL